MFFALHGVDHLGVHGIVVGVMGEVVGHGRVEWRVKKLSLLSAEVGWVK